MPAAWQADAASALEEADLLCQVNAVPKEAGDEVAPIWDLSCTPLALDHSVKNSSLPESDSVEIEVKTLCVWLQKIKYKWTPKCIVNFGLIKTCCKQAMHYIKAQLSRDEMPKIWGVQRHRSQCSLPFSDLFKHRNMKKLLHTDCCAYVSGKKQQKILQMCWVWTELAETSFFSDTQPEIFKFSWIVWCSLYFFNGILLSEFLEKL